MKIKFNLFLFVSLFGPLLIAQPNDSITPVVIGNAYSIVPFYTNPYSINYEKTNNSNTSTNILKTDRF